MVYICNEEYKFEDKTNPSKLPKQTASPKPPNKVFLGQRSGSVTIMENTLSKTEMENQDAVKGS